MWDEARKRAYGARLVALRRLKKKHLVTAALEMGMRPQTLDELEKGLRRPYEQSREKFAEYYGVDPDTLQPALPEGSSRSANDPRTLASNPYSSDGNAPPRAPGSDQELKDLLFRLYQKLGPRADDWLEQGYAMARAGRPNDKASGDS